MKPIVGVLLFLLLVQLSLAATVTEKGSGIVRGSISYQFTYEPADRSATVIDDVGPNDLITIVYGITPSGLPIKYEMFFKTPIQGVARWDVLKGERGLSMSLDETVEIDLESDGSVELLMRYDSIDNRRRMAFSLFPHGTAPTPEPSAPEPTPEPEDPEPIVDEVDEPVVQPTPTPTPPPEPPAMEVLPDRIAPVVVEQKGSGSTLLIVILLLILVGGLIHLYRSGFFDEMDPKQEKEHRKKVIKKVVLKEATPEKLQAIKKEKEKPDKRQEKREHERKEVEKDIEQLRKTKKFGMVTRTPRKR